MDSDHVWALVGLFCLLVMFAMVVLGVRNVRDDDASPPRAPERKPGE